MIILYARARQFTLIKPHSTEEYKLVPVNVWRKSNKMPEVTCDGPVSRPKGRGSIPVHCSGEGPSVGDGSKRYLACKTLTLNSSLQFNKRESTTSLMKLEIRISFFLTHLRINRHVI